MQNANKAIMTNNRLDFLEGLGYNRELCKTIVRPAAFAVISGCNNFYVYDRSGNKKISPSYEWDNYILEGNKYGYVTLVWSS